ncbi:ubiquinol oxidase subunit II [Mangrovicoccus sp. HB182678]|uniref:Ubiquinol oxidase polypeptide II n=2 Tax=Mangrovicoccus algicola TaxID=2771008 RepID=A0A8J6YVE4_9RHOB|nr:ubiquinol oxidase subunit II [Mangrovicoccus algicola]MBE3638530.1 ubiquinol oxidase subunit II [Mangrovicoccus algicola]
MAVMAAALSGCQYDVLFPAGWVGAQQRDLLVISTLLMLVVIIPVIFMAIYFPVKYRADREDKSDYDPAFAHSNKLEAIVWGGPIIIILILGWLTWIYTHRLDPYRPLDMAGEPVEVEAVSLDWKWLFIYPQYGIASVNELAVPEGRPINFRLTSSTVMNTFSVPALGGMIYSMAGMETKLHLVADETGTFAGRSAHYSGPGFSWMTFDTISMEEGDFEGWIEKVRAEGGELSRASYLELEKPTIAEPVHYYASVADGLFDRVRGMCVEEGKACMDQMMMIDEAGGGGLEGIPLEPLFEYDPQRAIDGFGNLLPSDDLSAQNLSYSDDAYLLAMLTSDADALCRTTPEQDNGN